MSKILLRHTLTKKFLTFWTSLSLYIFTICGNMSIVDSGNMSIAYSGNVSIVDSDSMSIVVNGKVSTVDSYVVSTVGKLYCFHC